MELLPETLALVDLCTLLISSISVGFLIGFLFYLVGLAIAGVLKIFKKA